PARRLGCGCSIFLAAQGPGSRSALRPPGRTPETQCGPPMAAGSFSFPRSGSFTSIYEKPASGNSDEGLLLKSADVKHPRSWSPDGKVLFYDGFDAGTGKASVWVLPLEGDKKPRSFLRGDFDVGGARVSPDGRFVAYGSDETGVPEVYVRSFSPDA